MRGAPTLAGIWVFFDALRRRIPRPLRWAVGTMLLLVVIFPWYLARRSKPQSPVPFVEAEVGPVTRFLLFALLIFFLASLIFYIVQGPAPRHRASSASQGAQDAAASSQATITNLRPWKEVWRAGGWRDEGSRLLPGALSAQAETSAPSDARQT